MTNHPVFSDDMREIAESFVLETQELFDELNNDLLRLEQTDDTLPVIEKIFRAVHTVKGTSGFLSLDQLNLLSHSYEDVLNQLRQREVTFHPDMMDVMFAAFDMMTVLLKQIADCRIEHIPMDGLLDDLERLARDGSSHSSRSDDAGSQMVAAGDGAYVRGDGAYLRSDGSPIAHVDEFTPNITPAEEAASWSRGGESVRVSVERLDELLALVSDLAHSRNRIARILSDADVKAGMNDLFAELSDASTRLDATTSQLQSAVLQTRMVPVGRVFTRFQRVIRDLAREAGKEVDLLVEGVDIELDKSMMDDIGDSFLHLVRNAVDHGIESPADRKRKGKPERGRLVLRAQQDGGYIVITVEDDGAGIDVDALRNSAVRRGFVGQQEAADMHREEIVNLIFTPGLTTSGRTTRISGRGVGMDVVRTAISRLGGDVQVESDYGRGTRFTLRVPVSLSVMQCLLAECGNGMYAIPLAVVSEVVAVKRISTVRGRLVLRLRDEVVPLVDVGDALDLETSARRDRCAVIIRVCDERLGLIVDRLHGQDEVFIKPLTPYPRALDGFLGTSNIGDGRIAKVLDVNDIVAMDAARRHGATSTAAAWGIDEPACATPTTGVAN